MSIEHAANPRVLSYLKKSGSIASSSSGWFQSDHGIWAFLDVAFDIPGIAGHDGSRKGFYDGRPTPIWSDLDLSFHSYQIRCICSVVIYRNKTDPSTMRVHLVGKETWIVDLISDFGIVCFAILAFDGVCGN